MAHRLLLLMMLLGAPEASIASDLPSTPSATLADSVGNCFDCVLGLFDDIAMTKKTGEMLPGVAKDIYIGIHFGAGYNDLTGIEFSIAGMRLDEDGIILLTYEGVTPISQVSWYFPQAPADTSFTSTGEGGMLIMWFPAVYGDLALVRLNLLSYNPPSDHVLRVKRMYPTSNPAQWHTPIIVQNRDPLWPVARISGDCYVLNWSGDPNVSCDVVTAIEKSTWLGVKQLYR